VLLDIDIKGVTCDSRKVKPGSVFVAIKGEKMDGSKFIQEAIENGASVIYTGEKLDFLPDNIPVIKVENPRTVLARLLARFYGYPSEKLNVIGITGTNGKTTTAHMIETIFRTAGFNTGLIGSILIKVGDKYYPHLLTTPNSENIQYFLSEMVDREVYAAIMEVSSHGLKHCRVDHTDFNVAVHTNITLDHMDTHIDFQDYISTKRRLFNMLPAGGAAVINTDDQYGLELVRENTKPLILSYGLGSKSSITASSIDFNDRGISYTCCLQRSFTNMIGNDTEPQEIALKLQVSGKHNVYNSLAAVSVGLLYGIEPLTIQKALENFKGVWRRMQKIYDSDFTIIDDFSHNPGSYNAAFETIGGMNYNGLYIVCAIRGNRGVEINRKNGAAIASWALLLGAKEVIATSSLDTVGEADRVDIEEKKAFMLELEKGGVMAEHYGLLEEAIDKSLEKVEKGDMILLMGAQGMNEGQNIILSKINDRSEIKK